MQFTNKELKSIMEDSNNSSIKNKCAKLLKLKTIDHTYAYYIDNKGNVSKHFKNTDEIHTLLKKKIGEWTMKTANKWAGYMVVEIEYDNEVGSFNW